MSGDPNAVQVARDYYDSTDADHFYQRIWGGEDIHIGLYDSPSEPILDASRRTVAHMADLLGELSPDDRVLDLGAGYGGAARYLAQNFGCSVVALNLSEVENQRHRELNRSDEAYRRIEVVPGNFEDLPFPDAGFSVVWSQDAFLHAGDRARVIAEAARVLEPNGVLVFTDPMRADACPSDVLAPVLERLHLTDLGSPAYYREAAGRAGLVEVGFEDHTPQLARHYRRVHDELRRRHDELREVVSEAYLQRMATGLMHWVTGGEQGHLCWGIFRFRKTA